MFCTRIINTHIRDGKERQGRVAAEDTGLEGLTDDDFAPVLDREEFCALSEAIYQAYKSVLPKRKVRREIAAASSEEGSGE